MSRSRPRAHRHGFTLIELLVVIGIIALLMAILLPVLSMARRQAYTIKCASNMRQIAAAVLMYTSDSKGMLMPAGVQATGSSSGPYRYGCFWAAELVNDGYISAPALIINTATSTVTPPSDLGVFQCPEGIPPNEANNIANSTGGTTNYPTSALNNSWTDGAIPNFSALSPNPYGQGTYYQLNCRQSVVGASVPASMYTTGGFNNPPFVYFVYDGTAAQTAADLANAYLQRKISQIKHSDLMVMIGEASTLYWTANQPSGSAHYAPCLGARHGSRSSDGTNAYANFAFFDGHVALLPTAPIDSTAAGPNITVNGTNLTTAINGCPAMTQGSGTVFTLFNDGQ